MILGDLMSTICPLCGRPKDPKKMYCEYCEYVLCEICNQNLSRGYCAVCGKLICDNDSIMVGYARVCKECLKINPNLGDPHYLKEYIETKRRFLPKTTKKLVKIYRKRGYLPLEDHVYLHVGLDDIDSPYGMCTTYVGAVLFEKLLSFGRPMDYPLLVRLNPNIPMKTRGNAAVALRFKIPRNALNNVKREVLNTIEKHSHTFFPKTQPSVTIYVTPEYRIHNILFEIYEQAVHDILPTRMVLEELDKLDYGEIEIYAPENKKIRGITGSVAAIGAVFKDYTYELIAYRLPGRSSQPRKIDISSVREMDQKFRMFTFDNISNGRLLIAPTGPDPVLFGIRGDYPEKLLDAFKIIKHEPISKWCIFRTNQGTHEHVLAIKDINDARPFQTIKYIGKVVKIMQKKEKTIIHTSCQGFNIENYTYKIQKELRKVASLLMRNDEVIVIGNIVERKNNNLKINVEEIIIINLFPLVESKNPICPSCGRRLKKKDVRTYYCPRCRRKYDNIKKILILNRRKALFEKKRYETPPQAHRHLTLPTKRMFYRAKKLSGLFKPYFVIPITGDSKKELSASAIKNYIDTLDINM